MEGASATILVLSAFARSSGLSSLADAAEVPASAVVFSPAMATSEGLICSAPLTDVGAGVMFGAGSLACVTCTGSASSGVTTTRTPIRVMPHSSEANLWVRRMQPCEAG